MPRHIVCLTFDHDHLSGLIARGLTTPTAISRGEYDVVVIPRLVTLLERYGIKATFFTPGHTIDSTPSAVTPYIEAGHELAHHGWTHRLPVTMSREEEEEEGENEDKLKFELPTPSSALRLPISGSDERRFVSLVEAPDGLTPTSSDRTIRVWGEGFGADSDVVYVYVNNLMDDYDAPRDDPKRDIDNELDNNRGFKTTPYVEGAIPISVRTETYLEFEMPVHDEYFYPVLPGQYSIQIKNDSGKYSIFAPFAITVLPD